MKAERNNAVKSGDEKKPINAKPVIMKKNSTDIYIVGVGGSAGGLPAFIELLENVPHDSGLAFVIVQHLLAESKSNLSEILSSKITLSVKEVTKNTPIEPNHVYVIPSNKNIFLKNNLLQLSPRAQNGPNLSIDEFFVSLAKGKKQNAIGVILSGTGSDGTLGMKAIREAGGITFAQDKKAAFSAMPDSVISAKLADYVLNPTKIAKKLYAIAKDANFSQGDILDVENSDLSESEESGYQKILKILLTSSDIDFTYYKQGTLKRRIKRRMDIQNFQDFSEYIAYLENNPEEVANLYQDILIKVTNFFRDRDVFDFVKQKILPKIFKQQPESIRVWVPGCSTGEEVYSWAITLAEYMEKNKNIIPVQIFGTDISESALATARQGKYTESIEKNVPTKILNKYFIKNKTGYEIKVSIRAMGIFAKHNMIKDIPFTKMDIVSCRNMLIYLDSVLQKKSFPIFHYALKPKGYLVLGTAETATNFQDLFLKVNQNQKIYSKKVTSFPTHIDFSAPNPPQKHAEKNPGIETMNLEKKVDKIILSRHAPAGVIINDDLAIVQFRGDVSPYLKHPAGRATLDLVKMSHRTLLAKLLDMINHVRKNRVTLRGTCPTLSVDIEVVPLEVDSSKEKYFLILFKDTHLPSKQGVSKKTKNTKVDSAAFNELEQELSSTVSELQTLVETRDTANEELRSANEEVMSANEELQSTNEELETTKEELQSTNEELMTLNYELQNRNAGLRIVEEYHKKIVPELKLRNEELNRKDEFISILGHELRNPLAPIIQSVDLANRHGVSDPEIKNLLGIIERQANSMSNIINGLLDAARAQSGKIKLELKVSDLNTLVRHAIETVQPSIKDRKHKLKIELANKPIYLNIDPLRIEQIIINLIDNAVKYTPVGGTIQVKVIRESNNVLLTVKDNGIGISKEMLPKIFDLFSQAVKPLHDYNSDGLGVGLMLSKTLTKLHNGSLLASSAGLGKGSKFILQLPIEESLENLNKQDEGPTPTNIKLKKRKIIVVDDNIIHANLMGKVFTLLNQDVTVVYDGASVIELVKTNIPDIIFIDIIMPNMSGYDLIKILRENPTLKKTKMIALTGFGEEYRQKSKNAGFDKHLIKPVGITEFEKLLAKL